MTVYDLLNPDSTEVEEQRVISAPGATTGDVLTVNADDTISPAPSGGSQPFVKVILRHSADFTNVSGNAPALTLQSNNPQVGLTLPPSLFGDASIIDVKVDNDTGAAVAVGGALVVQNAAGTVWIEQDTATDTAVADGANASIDFSANGGSAGAGLSWNAGTKQIDIASAGVYSAFVSLYVLTA